MNPINFGANRFCGPAAISIITGCTTDDAVRDINTLRGCKLDKKVVGCYSNELVEVLKRRGWSHSYYTHMTGSLYSILCTLSEDGLYIMVVPGHFITIEKKGTQRFICDTFTKKPLNAGASARLGQAVLQVIKVWK